MQLLAQLHSIVISEEELSGSEANAVIFKSEALEMIPLALLKVSTRLLGMHMT